MTQTGYTHLALLIDRSGSMQNIANDAEGGVNSLIRKQREETTGDQKCTVTLAQFDNEYNVLHEFVDIRSLADPVYKLIPRGSTALLDSLGRLISKTGATLRELPESSRPSEVIVVVATDGFENASREYTKAQIKQMIQTQQTQFNWTFIYLGANQDAFTEAGNLGFNPSTTINFAASPLGTRNVYASTSGLVTAVRGGAAATYSSADRDAAVSE